MSRILWLLNLKKFHSVTRGTGKYFSANFCSHFRTSYGQASRGIEFAGTIHIQKFTRCEHICVVESVSYLRKEQIWCRILDYEQHSEANGHAIVILLPHALSYHSYMLMTASRSVAPQLGIIGLAVIDRPTSRGWNVLTVGHHRRPHISTDQALSVKKGTLSRIWTARGIIGRDSSSHHIVLPTIHTSPTAPLSRAPRSILHSALISHLSRLR